MENQKKDFLEFLPSLEDAKNFSLSSKHSAVTTMTELGQAIREKYNGKIQTIIQFEVVGKNKFECSLNLKFDRFNNHWFHFLSFRKEMNELWPVEIFTFDDKKFFSIALDKDDFEKNLKSIIKSEKTECLLLGNL